MGRRPRLYVNLLADYRDDSGGYSHDSIPRDEERGPARLLERIGNPDRRAGNLVLHAGINQNSGVHARFPASIRLNH